MFSGGKRIPCVGFSVGVERIFATLLRRTKLEDVKSNEVQVYIIEVGKTELLSERMKIAKELWDHDIKVKFLFFFFIHLFFSSFINNYFFHFYFHFYSMSILFPFPLVKNPYLQFRIGLGRIHV